MGEDQINSGWDTSRLPLAFTKTQRRLPCVPQRARIGAAVSILLVTAAAFLTPLIPESASAKERKLITTLRLVREQIELYRRHHDSYPPSCGETFKACMTQYTRRDHRVSPCEDEARGYVFGPYLLAFPANPYTGSSDVSTTGSVVGAGWQYDPLTGRFRTSDGLNDHL